MYGDRRTGNFDDPFDRNDEYDYATPKQSVLGIASCVVSVVAGLLEIGVLAVGEYLDTATPGGIPENSREEMLLGMGLLVGLLAALVGIGLGIAGLCQQDRKKTFAVVGASLGGLVILGLITLVMVGLTMQ